VPVAQVVNLSGWCHALVLVACLASSGARAQSYEFPPAENRCVYPEEEGAFRVDQLRTRMMIAALVCQRDHDYNRFWRQHATELAFAQRVMARQFQRHDGQQAEPALAAFQAGQANREATVAMGRGAAFCADAAKLFADAEAVTDGPALIAFAERGAPLSPLGLPRC
jgi:hypothetical protein